jgi:hypothetical protein
MSLLNDAGCLRKLFTRDLSFIIGESGRNVHPLHVEAWGLGVVPSRHRMACQDSIIAPVFGALLHGVVAVGDALA